MSILRDIAERIKESRFCYAKECGQGLVHKSECTCDKINNPCQAVKDSQRFHEAFKDVEYGDMKRRNEIVKEIKPQFEDSQWWKDNIDE